jgi:polyhydroxyalkanoate synthesis regulator phasin
VITLLGAIATRDTAQTEKQLSRLISLVQPGDVGPWGAVKRLVDEAYANGELGTAEYDSARAVLGSTKPVDQNRATLIKRLAEEQDQYEAATALLCENIKRRIHGVYGDASEYLSYQSPFAAAQAAIHELEKVVPSLPQQPKLWRQLQVLWLFYGAQEKCLGSLMSEVRAARAAEVFSKK